MKQSWSRAQQSRARQKLKTIAEHNGGWAGMAKALGNGLTRSAVQAWYSRGRVTARYAAAVVSLAPQDSEITTADICREANQLLAETPRTPL